MAMRSLGALDSGDVGHATRAADRDHFIRLMVNIIRFHGC